MREKLVLDKAKSWGFPTQLNDESNWRILPNNPEETWQITEIDSRWILSINNIPQLYLDSGEAIAFLARRSNVSSKSLEVINSTL